MKISSHAWRRLGQHVRRVPPAEVDTWLDTARKDGVRYEETTGRLRHYLNARCAGRPNTEALIYDGCTLIISDDTLVTVYPIRPYLRKDVSIALRRRAQSRPSPPEPKEAG